MKILVTGPESSGCKMVAHLLRQAGGEVTQSSPNYREIQHKPSYNMNDFDSVVLVVRSYFPNIRSMIDADHANDAVEARWMVGNGLKYIFETYKPWTSNMYLITYEALVHEPEAKFVLIKALGLDTNAELDEIGNANAKYYGREYFRDQRDLHER